LGPLGEVIPTFSDRDAKLLKSLGYKVEKTRVRTPHLITKEVEIKPAVKFLGITIKNAVVELQTSTIYADGYSVSID
jgi:hypothetical protein